LPGVSQAEVVGETDSERWGLQIFTFDAK